jgi:hypothetical protein
MPSDLVRSCVDQKRHQHKLTNPLGKKNLVIMADLSNPSNMAARDKLLEEYKREYDRAVKRLFLSRCHTTEQGVKVIQEWQIPSTIDILMEMRSSGTLSNIVSGIIKDFIDQENSSIQALVVQKSIIEKTTNNPCKDLPICDVVSQDTVRPSQPEIVEPNSPCKYTETNSSTSTLGGQQNKGKGAGCIATSLTGSPTDPTTSSRVLQNRSKPRMVKPRKPEIGIWKTIESKSRHKHEKEKPKSIKKLPAKSSKQKDMKHASRVKNSKQPKFVPKQKFHDQNRQWNNFPTSMPFSSYGSSMNMPWGTYFSLPYSWAP